MIIQSEVAIKLKGSPVESREQSVPVSYCNATILSDTLMHFLRIYAFSKDSCISQELTCIATKLSAYSF